MKTLPRTQGDCGDQLVQACLPCSLFGLKPGHPVSRNSSLSNQRWTPLVTRTKWATALLKTRTIPLNRTQQLNNNMATLKIRQSPLQRWHAPFPPLFSKQNVTLSSTPSEFSFGATKSTFSFTSTTNSKPEFENASSYSYTTNEVPAAQAPVVASQMDAYTYHSAEPSVLPPRQPVTVTDTDAGHSYTTNGADTGYTCQTNELKKASPVPNSQPLAKPAGQDDAYAYNTIAASPPAAVLSAASQDIGAYSYQSSNPPTIAAPSQPAVPAGAASSGYSYSDNSSNNKPAVSNEFSFGRANPRVAAAPQQAAAPSAFSLGPAPPKPAAADGPKSPLRDWTQEMYSHLSSVQKESLNLSGSSEITNPNAAKYASRGTTMSSLIDVATSFTKMATALGTTIIEEKFKPVEMRSIKSQNVGGVAGGEKYIHEGIFFKFAVDDHNLYGSVERAMKTAGHEMKGLTALVDWELRTVGLHSIKFPLMILVDYRGSRLAATSSLPIGSKTLVVGSGDSGKTINGPKSGPGAGRNSTERLYQLFKEWGRYLHLREHEMFTAKKTKEIVPIAFDVEGHVGRDGNLWCVDFARVFPPSGYSKVKGGFLFQLLRPEFVRYYAKPLCADAYLRALVDRTMDQDINDATKYLKTDYVVTYAKIIDHMPFMPTRLLALIIHQYGINYRYLRFVACALKREDIRKQVNAEIIARVVKNMIRREFRELKSIEQAPYLRTVARFFNALFSNLPVSAMMWEQTIHSEIDYRFEAPGDEFFTALEISMRKENASILSPLGPDATGAAAKGTSRRRANGKKSGSGYAGYAGSGYNYSYASTQTDSASTAPLSTSAAEVQPTAAAVKKSSSGRLIKQVVPFNIAAAAEEDDQQDSQTESYAAVLPSVPIARTTRAKGHRRPSSGAAYTGYDADPGHSYNESTDAVLADVAIKKEVAAFKERVTIKKSDVNLTELFNRLLAIMCIDVNPSARQKLDKMLAGVEDIFFDESDILDYRPCVKSMFLTSFQQAYHKKLEADRTDDFYQREMLLVESYELYLDCLERNTRNAFALHNFARVLLALAPFKSQNGDEEKLMHFLAKKMSTIAEQENKLVTLKKAPMDLYQFSELIDEDGKARRITPAKTWCRDEVIKRLLLLRMELDETANAIQEAQENADSDMMMELIEMLKMSYVDIFDELKDEADEQGSLINSVPRKVAVHCWNLFVSVYPQNQRAWKTIIDEIYLEGRVYITQDQWNALVHQLYGC